MARVAPGVQITDRDGLDPLIAQHRDRSVERGRIERDFDAAIGAQPLAHPEAQMARHQLLGRRHAQIVAIVLEALAHLDDVAMAFGGEEAEPCALAFEERVGRDRGAVDDALGRREQRGAFEAEPPGQPSEAVEDAERRVVRGRGHLGEHRRAARVDRDEIGKRAADIDADAVHR